MRLLFFLIIFSKKIDRGLFFINFSQKYLLKLKILLQILRLMFSVCHGMKANKIDNMNNAAKTNNMKANSGDSCKNSRVKKRAISFPTDNCLRNDS